jgi:hypothetical protein
VSGRSLAVARGQSSVASVLGAAADVFRTGRESVA